MKTKLATLWLDGCSGCHMSFLDMDERLIELAQKIEVVASPYVDFKYPDYFPDDIDVAIVEGSISTEEDLHKIKLLRAKSKFLISLGDCAITGNVSGMRNLIEIPDMMNFIYREMSDANSDILPTKVVPPLLKKVIPLNQAVTVDLFIPGCPPPADAIYYALSELLNGNTPDMSKVTRFGK